MTTFTGLCSYPHGGNVFLFTLLFLIASLMTTMYGASSCRFAVVTFDSDSGSFETYYDPHNNLNSNSNSVSTTANNTATYRAGIGLFQWLKPDPLPPQTTSATAAEDDNEEMSEVQDGVDNNGRRRLQELQPYDYEYDKWYEGYCVGYQSSMLEEIDDHFFEVSRGFAIFAVLLAFGTVLWCFFTSCLHLNQLQVNAFRLCSFLGAVSCGMTFLFVRSAVCNTEFDETASCDVDYGGYVMIAAVMFWAVSFVISIAFMKSSEYYDPEIYTLASVQTSRLPPQGNVNNGRGNNNNNTRGGGDKKKSTNSGKNQKRHEGGDNGAAVVGRVVQSEEELSELIAAKRRAERKKREQQRERRRRREEQERIMAAAMMAGTIAASSERGERQTRDDDGGGGRHGNGNGGRNTYKEGEGMDIDVDLNRIDTDYNEDARRREETSEERRRRRRLRRLEEEEEEELKQREEFHHEVQEMGDDGTLTSVKATWSRRTASSMLERASSPTAIDLDEDDDDDDDKGAVGSNPPEQPRRQQSPTSSSRQLAAGTSEEFADVDDDEGQHRRHHHHHDDREQRRRKKYYSGNTTVDDVTNDNELEVYVAERLNRIQNLTEV